jgi:apolipoprotein N-acyltransferase
LDSGAASSYAGLFVVCAVVGPPEFVGLALLAQITANASTRTRVVVLAGGVFAIERWFFVPWGLLGYSQLELLGVAQLAAVGGVPLISAGLVAIQVALADSWLRRKSAARLAMALAAAWLALAIAGLPVAEALRPNPTDVTAVDLLLVQPNLPRGERWGDALQPLNLYRVRTFADRAVAENPGIDAVVLPENLLTARVDASPELSASLSQWVDALGVPVLSGLVLSASPPRPDLYRSSVVWLEPGRGITARLDKERAIPLLESSRRFPGDSLLAALFGNAARVPKVQEVTGSDPLLGPVRVTPLLCYEVLFPKFAARRRTPESVAIANLADDSWAPGDTVTRHLTNIARFRAIEQRLPLVRVAHGGLSSVVDEFGRVVETLPRHAYAARRVSLRPLPLPSFRERAALFGLPLGAFAVVGWGFALMRKITFGRRTGEMS